MYRRVAREPGQGVGLECLPGGGCCDSKPVGKASKTEEIKEVKEIRAAEGARKAKQFTALHWRGDDAKSACGCSGDGMADAFSRFVAGAGVEQRFTVSAMAFQDALSLDLDRVRGCCIGDGPNLAPLARPSGWPSPTMICSAPANFLT